VIRTIYQVLEQIDPLNDYPTTDLLTNRLFAHQKSAWMLKSLLN